MATASIEKDKRFNLLYRPEIPHFFRVVVRPLDQGIKMPTMFVREYGDSLGEDVLLKVPSGAEWRVELLKVHGDAWLQKGWQEFAEFYSIKKYHFLVFGYEGNSQFHVTIFDTTASEIDYPVKSTRGGKKRVFKIVCRLRPRINNGSCEEASRDPPQSSKNYSDLSMKAKIKAYERDFKSENPFFVCSMPPSYVSGSFDGLNIPMTFVRSYLRKNYKDNFKLRLSEKKKTWPALVYINDKYGRIHGRGWRQFAEDNRLMVGDICLFEMVKRNKTFKVIICERA